MLRSISVMDDCIVDIMLDWESVSFRESAHRLSEEDEEDEVELLAMLIVVATR